MVATKNLKKTVEYASWTAVIIYLILYVIRIFPWITTEIPNDMHEFSTVNVVYKMLEGINPYQLNTFIDSAYVYGITLPALGALLYKIIGFGINLTVFLRLFSLFFIVASSLLVAKEIYSTVKDKFASILGFTMTLVIGWWTAPIIVTTNTMGVFFMLITYYIVRRYSSITSVILIAILTLISFYTKPYFLFVFGIVSIWYFLTSCKNLIVYILSFSILGIFSVLLINHYFPLYFYITIYTHQAISGFEWMHTIKEWAMFLLFYFPLFIITIISIVHYFKTNKIKITEKVKIDDDLFYIITIICSTIVLVKLGGHWGAHLTYFYHLLLPILIIYSLTHIDLIQNYLFKVSILLSIIIFSVFHIFFISSLPAYRTEEAKTAIERMNHWMSAYSENDILILTQYAGPYGRAHDFKNYYSSHNWQFSLAKRLTKDKTSTLFPIHKDFINRVDSFENSIKTKIIHKIPQMIITTGGIPEVKNSDFLIEQNYKLVDKFDIPAGRVSNSVILVYTQK